MFGPPEEHWVADHTGHEARLLHSAKRDMALRNDDQLDFTGAMRDEVDRQNESLRYRLMLDATQIQSPIIGDNKQPRQHYKTEKVNVWRLLSSAFLASFAIVYFWYSFFVDVASVDGYALGLSESRLSAAITVGAACLAAAPYILSHKKLSTEKLVPVLPNSLAEQRSPDRQRDFFIANPAMDNGRDWNEHQEFISSDVQRLDGDRPW